MKKESPIIFSTPMVKAILSDSKTQTRRVIKPQPEGHRVNYELIEGEHCFCLNNHEKHDPCEYDFKIKSPYGNPGDMLYVRETYCDANIKHDTCDKLCFRASVKGCRHGNYQKGWPSWKSPLYMPKRLARIWLEITDVRVERIKDITPSDIIKEGITPASLFGYDCDTENKKWDEWINLWNSINEKRGYGWDVNPWVWVVAFKRI
jgi:hypothetical protein